MDDLSKRLGLALKKFLAFEASCGRKQSFQAYEEVICKALEGEELGSHNVPLSVHERLVAVGLLVSRVNVITTLSGARQVRLSFEFPSIEDHDSRLSRESNTDKWLVRPFNAVEICRFFAMDAMSLEWILEDLQKLYASQREQLPYAQFTGAHSLLGKNITILSELWKIALHWQLTEGDDAVADELTDFVVATPLEQKGYRPVFKEKLGLAKTPDYFQVMRIKATSAYMRQGVVGL